MKATAQKNYNDDEHEPFPLSSELIGTVISSKFPDGLTNRDWKKIKRLAHGMRKGFIVIELDEYRAVGFETRKKYDASLDEV